jgi:hypothetical protein
VSRPRRDHAAARKWGLSVAWLWAAAEQPALTAEPSRAPQVNLTVIQVEAGAYLNVGGLIYDPRLIPAVPQQRAAITATTITEGEQE